MRFLINRKAPQRGPKSKQLLSFYIAQQLVSNENLNIFRHELSSSTQQPYFISSHPVKGLSESRDDSHQLMLLMKQIFPFSFIPENSIQENTREFSEDQHEHVYMNLQEKNSLNNLINLLRDYNTCRDAIINQMLFHKIGRILKEDKSLNGIINSKEFIEKEKQIHTCLWILLHCLVLVGREATDILLSVFRLNDFYHYFTEKDFTKFQAQKLFSPSTGAPQLINTAETFLYSVDIIWLAYAIVGHLYCQGLNKRQDHADVNKLNAYPSKYLEVLKINKDMFEQLSFVPAMEENSKNEISDRYHRNILHTAESILSISNQIGFELFELYLSYTSLLMRCDDSSLVQLVLSIFGQLLANVNDFILATIVKNKRLNIVRHIEHLLCCTDETVVIILGKCLFTLFLRDVNFIMENVLNQSKFLNEIIYWSLNALQTSTKVQYLNLLFLLVIQSEKLSINLITNTKINILYHISHQLGSQFSQQKSKERTPLVELEPSLQFVLIQLLYGISTHSSCHAFIIEYTTTSNNGNEISTLNIIHILKALSFSQYPLTRYYSFLIWSNLLTLSSYRSASSTSSTASSSMHTDSKLFDNRYTRYLCRNEQVLNLLMYAFKEETEMIIKRMITLLLKDICSIRQNNYERIIILEHFNLLFESIDLLHFQMSYLMDVYETRNGIFNEEESVTVDQSVQLSIAQIHLITTIVRMDSEVTSNETSGTSPTLELLKTQYQIQRYISDLLLVLDKRGDAKNANTIRALATSVLQLEL